MGTFPNSPIPRFAGKWGQTSSVTLQSSAKADEV
jgi:hypothetical protein